MEVAKQIYRLRRDLILIGLTGRTGSGCSTVAKILETSDFSTLKSEYKEINTGTWDNDSRKNRIVYNYMKEHWHPFTTICASDIIFYYSLHLNFEQFVDELSKPYDENPGKPKASKNDPEVESCVNELRDKFQILHETACECESNLDKLKECDDAKLTSYKNLILEDIPKFRNDLEQQLKNTKIRVVSGVLQRWGNNIRKFNSVLEPEITDGKTEADYISEEAPSCLAIKIRSFINLLITINNRNKQPSNIVIDALRNPYEVLFYRELYSCFYLMSINTDEHIRITKLIEKGLTLKDIEEIDKKEKEQSDFIDSYMKIDINKCIELSDIHLTHDGTDFRENRKLVNQILTYLALIRHPGLVPPSPIERVMQLAYIAKLNSGCLSRQVGAAVTNSEYSVQAIGWNTVPQGQTPCSLRTLTDLCNREDIDAFSDYEHSEPFKHYACELNQCYGDKFNIGLPLSYCFKDIHTSTTDKQLYNQVHTRSLHAEENAFLQLAKYGTQGIDGGKLFTTSSCCELCGKKAYQLGIKEIYYIDSYPGITHKHIIESGGNRPQMNLFHGAIGRAYINLYNPLLPLKDEIEALSGVKVKEICYTIKKTGNSTSETKES